MSVFALYGGEIELEFDESRHVYRVGGDIVPSVTGVTGVIDKSGPLMWWAVSQCLEFVQENWTAELDEVELKGFLHDAQRAHLKTSRTATDIGHLAHEWIENHLAGKSQELPRNPQLRSTIESFLEWFEANHVLAYETEFKCYSAANDYAGTCDFDGIINGERAIADWKTGRAVYPEHLLQTAAYEKARREELNIEYDARYIIVLPKDGGKIIVERIDGKHFTRDWMGFYGALRLFRSLNEIKDDKKRK